MKDSQFKNLEHKFKDFKIIANGQQLDDGYKPDVVLNKGSEYVILESEHGSSRKHFLGGLMKAAKYLSGSRTGILVFVIKIKENTNESQISDHLAQYLHWIKSLTNLKEVYVISDANYCPSKIPLEICEKEFLKASMKVP